MEDFQSVSQWKILFYDNFYEKLSNIVLLMYEDKDNFFHIAAYVSSCIHEEFAEIFSFRLWNFLIRRLSSVIRMMQGFNIAREICGSAKSADC